MFWWECIILTNLLDYLVDLAILYIILKYENKEADGGKHKSYFTNYSFNSFFSVAACVGMYSIF